MNNLENKMEAKKAATPVAAPSSGLKSEKIFNMMATYLERGEGKTTVPKVSAVFGFEITPKKGAKPALIYEIDMKNG